MLKCFVVCFVVFLCVDMALCGPLVGRGGGGGGKGGRRGYIGSQAQDGGVARAPKKQGVSAWGVISLIMFVVLIGFGGYYGYICYPFLCKKERHYDVMDAASSTSASTPTTRSAEFEKMDPEFDGTTVFRYK